MVTLSVDLVVEKLNRMLEVTAVVLEEVQSTQTVSPELRDCLQLTAFKAIAELDLVRHNQDAVAGTDEGEAAE